MAERKEFPRAKLICGIISSEERFFAAAERHLAALFGKIDQQSPLFQFSFTDYYENQMGKNLKRKFLSFEPLIRPERLSEIKVQTNSLEEKIREELGVSFRAVNLDPGYLTASALIIATAKDFSHRIPLQHGIYAHLELMFTKTGARALDWTYPDFRTGEYQRFFLQVRRQFLDQIKKKP